MKIHRASVEFTPLTTTPLTSMAVMPAGSFALLTVVLTIGLAVVLSTAFRADVAANWNTYRCDPGVIPIAGAFKPATDARTDTEFARANAANCQKEYIQDAIHLAAEAPAAMARVAASTASSAKEVVHVTGDLFHNLWNFCYEVYSSFMDNMRGAAQLFANFLMLLHSMVNRLQAAIMSIIFALISLIMALVSSLQLVVIVAIVITGILLSLMIILFYLIAPISGLLMTMTAIISVVVISIGTAIAAATVSELFSVPGACFVPGTRVNLADGGAQTIETLPIGIRLADGGWVTAVHEFAAGPDTVVYDLHGVGVTGDHLVLEGEDLLPVEEHPLAHRRPGLYNPERLWCLTTTTRRIPCTATTPDAKASLFADWEEIPAKEYPALREWYCRVWLTLNVSKQDVPSVSAEILDMEAGLDPDCPVRVYGATSGWLGTGTTSIVPIKHVHIGDLVWDGSAFTRVLGRVRIEGGLGVNMVNVSANVCLTAGTWVNVGTKSDSWSLAGTAFSDTHSSSRHPRVLYHLYTASGKFVVGTGIQVRDASDVGLEHLAPLVKDIVLHK